MLAALFGQAAAAWKELSEDQRKQYMLLYAENAEDPALDNLPVPLGKVLTKTEPTTDKASISSLNAGSSSVSSKGSNSRSKSSIVVSCVEISAWHRHVKAL